MRIIHKLTVALCSVVLLASCSNNVKLQGTISGAADQTIQLQLVGAESIQIVDSTKISADGSFKLEAPESTEPTFYRAVLPSGKAIVFVADSAETVSVNADYNAANWFESVKFDNSEESALTMQIVAPAVTLQDKLQAYVKEANRAKADELQAEIENYKKTVKKFIFDHPSSWASYYALYQTILGMQVFDIYDIKDHVLFSAVATSLDNAYHNEPRVKTLCDNVLQARAHNKKQQQLQEMINNAEVANSPDIELPDKNGKMHKLSDLRGKVVILQFWASTEKASRNNNRQLASLYAKYKSKGLEIYSVSLDTSKILWEDALDVDKVTWTSVCDLKGIASPAPALYNVRPVQAADGSIVVEIPQLFILDKDGALIGKNLFGKRLDDRMAEIFR
ncbi:MAG: TlpA disulfide reductase family protein [Bacteroidia bacterium]|nr:TlpA disulfide reductase family protein [Bacteroidia bacterium]